MDGALILWLYKVQMSKSSKYLLFFYYCVLKATSIDTNFQHFGIYPWGYFNTFTYIIRKPFLQILLILASHLPNWIKIDQRFESYLQTNIHTYHSRYVQVNLESSLYQLNWRCELLIKANTSFFTPRHIFRLNYLLSIYFIVHCLKIKNT